MNQTDKYSELFKGFGSMLELFPESMAEEPVGAEPSTETTEEKE